MIDKSIICITYVQNNLNKILRITKMGCQVGKSLVFIIDYYHNNRDTLIQNYYKEDFAYTLSNEFQ